jgi:hypothetical protein
MAELALQIETLGREGGTEGADELLAALESEFVCVRGQYEAIIAPAAAS